MKVRLLSLNVDKNMPFARFQARVVSSIKMYSDENLSFEHYDTMRELFEALQDALENDEIIITAVDTKHYIKMKDALISALEADVQYNPTILNMLESDEEMDDDTRKAFSSFPESATVFLSNDGLYSGFGIENGSQYLITLPIDNERINIILRNGVVPFLSKNIDTSDKNEFLSEVKMFENEKVSVAVNRLLESHSIVAVNGTENAEILKSCGDSVEHFDDVFIFTPHVEDKGEVNATEYAAQLAKVSLDLSTANIGASISDIYSAGETRYICIAVANSESAVVRKLYMSDSESEETFVSSAAVELIELIGEKAIGMQSIGIEVSDGGNVIPEHEKKHAGKASVIVLSCVLGAIIVLCAALGIVYKIQGEDGSVAKALNGVFGNTTTVTEATTQSAPETTTESATTPDKSSTIKLSDFMLADLINLEKNKKVEELSSTEPISGDTTTEPQSEVAEDKGAPKTIKVNGQDIDAKEAIARLVMTEMGEGYNTEAVKAQAVVIYTYLKYRDNNFEINGVTISDDYNEEVKNAVDAVYGEYLTYKDEVALTPYFALAAGKTANADSVFSQAYPYLTSVEIKGNPDASDEKHKLEKILSLGELKGILLDYDQSIVLGDNPANWIKINKHDAAVSSSIGYVKTVTVGDKEMSGIDFRMNVIGSSTLLSHCFTVSFDETTGTFTLSSYGNGIGVGMSQTGANSLAGSGSNYKKILSTYFKGTKLTKEEKI